MELKHNLVELNVAAVSVAAAHKTLMRYLADLSAADQAARQARRYTDRLVAEENRATSCVEADHNLSEGKLENFSLAVIRHTETAVNARFALAEAEQDVADLGDLETMLAQVEHKKMTAGTARLTMMSG